MNVRLAAQVFSNSVADALTFLREKEPPFQYVAATAKFCKVINDGFDILNCRNLHSKNPFQKPINDFNEGMLRARAEEVIHYIEELQLDVTKYVPMKQTAKKGTTRKPLKDVKNKEETVEDEHVPVESKNKDEMILETAEVVVQNEEVVLPKKRKYVRKKKDGANKENVALLNINNNVKKNNDIENSVATAKIVVQSEEVVLPKKRQYVRKNVANENLAPPAPKRKYIRKKTTDNIESTKNGNCIPTHVENADKEGNHFSGNCENNTTQPKKDVKNDVMEMKVAVNVLKSERYTGFLGMIISLRNIFELYKTCKAHGMKFLLSYKVLQDHIENFFSAVRSKGGFNDNPTCRQFESAYKRLLIHAEIAASTRNNCSQVILGF